MVIYVDLKVTDRVVEKNLEKHFKEKASLVIERFCLLGKITVTDLCIMSR